MGYAFVGPGIGGHANAGAGVTPASARPGTYVPRQTHDCDATVLVRRHLPGFLARLEENGQGPLPEFVPLLAALLDDPSEYVRRSVANHLNDIARDHPAIMAGWLSAAPPRGCSRAGPWSSGRERCEGSGASILKIITTRRYDPGEHAADLRINGQVVGSGRFQLRA